MPSSSPRPPRLSQNQRIWIFATVTGTLAIFMLVLQVKATLKENAEKAALAADVEGQQSPIDETAASASTSDDSTFTLNDHHDRPKAAEHSAEPFTGAQSEPALAGGPSLADNKHESQPALAPSFPDDAHGSKAQSRPAEVPFPAQPEPAAAPTPALAVVAPAETPSKNVKDDLFGSFADDKAKSDASAPKSDVVGDPKPVPEVPADANVPKLDLPLDLKSEPAPPANTQPELTAPVVPHPVPQESPTAKPPGDAKDDPFGPAAAVPAAPLEPAPVSVEPASPQVPAALPKLDAAPATTNEAPAPHPEPLDLQRAPEPKSPPTPDLALPVPQPEPLSPARDPIDIAAPPKAEPVKPEPALREAPESDSPNWKTRQPALDKAPVEPDIYREKQPAWRLVAPPVVNGDPDAILSANSPHKELHISVDKTTPKKSPIREILSYEIIVFNKSDEAVDGLLIEERVPDSMEVADVMPQAAFENGKLRWLLSALRPGERRKLEINLLPTKGGLAESVTTARALAAVSSNTNVLQSRLRIQVTAAEGRTGQVCPLVYRVTNTSREPIDELVLRTVLPSALTHDKGRSLDLPIGRLEPGESREARLHPRAQAPGIAAVQASVLVAGTSAGETTVNVHVGDSAGVNCCP